MASAGGLEANPAGGPCDTSPPHGSASIGSRARVRSPRAARPHVLRPCTKSWDPPHRPAPRGGGPSPHPQQPQEALSSPAWPPRLLRDPRARRQLTSVRSGVASRCVWRKQPPALLVRGVGWRRGVTVTPGSRAQAGRSWGLQGGRWGGEVLPSDLGPPWAPAAPQRPGQPLCTPSALRCPVTSAGTPPAARVSLWERRSQG